MKGVALGFFFAFVLPANSYLTWIATRLTFLVSKICLLYYCKFMILFIGISTVRLPQSNAPVRFTWHKMAKYIST